MNKIITVFDLPSTPACFADSIQYRDRFRSGAVRIVKLETDDSRQDGGLPFRKRKILLYLSIPVRFVPAAAAPGGHGKIFMPLI